MADPLMLVFGNSGFIKSLRVGPWLRYGSVLVASAVLTLSVNHLVSWGIWGGQLPELQAVVRLW